MLMRKTKPRRFLGRSLSTPLTRQQHRQYALGWPPGFERLRKLLWFQIGAVVISAHITMISATAFHESTHWRKHTLVWLGMVGIVLIVAAILVICMGCSAAINSSYGNFKRYTNAVWIISAIFITFHLNQLWAVVLQYLDDQCGRNKCYFSVFVTIGVILVGIVGWIAVPMWCSLLGRTLEREVLGEAKLIRSCPLEIRNSPELFDEISTTRFIPTEDQ